MGIGGWGMVQYDQRGSVKGCLMDEEVSAVCPVSVVLGSHRRRGYSFTRRSDVLSV